MASITTGYDLPTAQGAAQIAFTATAALRVRFVNRGNTTAHVFLAIGTGGAPAATDYEEYGAPLEAMAPPIENTQIIVANGDSLWAWSPEGNVTMRVSRMEG